VNNHMSVVAPPRASGTLLVHTVRRPSQTVQVDGGREDMEGPLEV